MAYLFVRRTLGFVRLTQVKKPIEIPTIVFDACEDSETKEILALPPIKSKIVIFANCTGNFLYNRCDPKVFPNAQRFMISGQLHSSDILKRFRGPEFLYIHEQYGSHNALGYPNRVCEITREEYRKMYAQLCKVPYEIGSEMNIRYIQE